ncbi:hypothetical protein [Nocardia thraciensis]
MAFQDIVAQLRQDITTAEDAGDDAAAARLRKELDKASAAADEAGDEQ